MNLPAWVSGAADILGIVGFILTIWVLIATRSIQKSFALRGRSPDLRKKLSELSKELPRQLKDWPASKNEALTSVEQARSILKNVLEKMEPQDKADVKTLISLLLRRKKGWFQYVPISEYTAPEMWSIFAKLQAVITTLELREKDALWK